MTCDRPSTLFNLAETFQINTSVADPRDVIYVTSVDVYFKYKPDANNNKSGTTNPGINCFLTDTVYNVPRVTANTFSQVSRLEYNQINTTSDASVPTKFPFNPPIPVKPGQLYAFLLSFDNNEAYTPWTAKTGSWLVGTRTVFPGVQANFVGEYFEYITPTDGVSDPQLAQTQKDYTSFWRDLSDTKMKFNVNIARFYIDGTPIVAANSIPNSTQIYTQGPIQSWDNVAGDLIYSFPTGHQEGISFDITQSTVQAFVGAQRVYQNTVPYPGGFANGSSVVTVATTANSTLVTANTNLPNGTVFNWNTVFNNYAGDRYVVLCDTVTRNIRRVVSVVANNKIIVDEPVSFTNTTAQFLIAPIARVDSIFPSSPLGHNDSFLWLTGSSANSTVRFVNNAIEAIAITAGGTGYNNSDVLYVKGYENITNKITGGYVAIANIQTNSSGGITAIYQSNLGCGFVNSAAVTAVVANSTNIGNTTSNTSLGSGATFSYTIGSTLNTEFTTNIFKSCVVNNIGVNDVLPFFDLTIPIGTSVVPSVSSIYYTVADAATFSGNMYYVGPAVTTSVTINERTRFNANVLPCFVSFSNEFVTPYANGSLNDQVSATNTTSNSLTLNLTTTSNNDYVCVQVDSAPGAEFGRFIINNDYTKEETDSGNAWAKHLTTHINFTRLAEDTRVYLTAYRPPNTDFQVYARIQNSSDPDNFNQAYWTRLQIVDGNTVFSSTSTTDDYVELTYGMQSAPNTSFTLAGTVATSNNSATITGTGTTFSANLAVNSLIKIYDPLFPASNYMVALVTAIANNTSLTIDRTVLSTLNAALVSQSLSVDVLNFSHQAFNDNLSDNVVRYYDSTFMKFEGYDNLQVKVVMLSSNQLTIPGIHNVRAVGVSA